MSDNLQHGINQACIFFYREFETEKEVRERIKSFLPSIKTIGIKETSPVLMLGVGYLVAKGCLTFRGGMDFGFTTKGYHYYLSLLENGDI